MRNIDALYELEAFVTWLRGLEQPYFGSFNFLRDLKPAAEESAEAGNSEWWEPDPYGPDEARIQQRVKAISHDEVLKRGALIWAMSFCDGDGMIAERLLAPYDEEFIGYFLAGLLATDRRSREVWSPNVVGWLSDMEHKHRLYLASEAVDEYPTAEQANQFVVRVLTDPERLMGLPDLERFVKMTATGAGWTTGTLIEAMQTARLVERQLRTGHSPQDYRDIRGFTADETAALLVAMEVSLKVLTTEDEAQTIHLNLSSVFDACYGQKTSLGVHDWIRLMLARAGVEPQRVKALHDYPPELNLHYTASPDIPVEDRGQAFVAYLATRFEAIYRLGVLLCSMCENASMQFNMKRHPGLASWVGSGLIPLASERWVLLPVLAALSGETREYTLNFRTPFLRGYRLIDKPVELQPITGLDDQTRRLIADIFVVPMLDVTSFQRHRPSWHLETSWYPTPGFLRTHKQMRDRLADLREDQIELLKDVDFSAYLKSMGYPGVEDATDECRGVRGLTKAVEIHTLAHLCPRQVLGYSWPLHFPELF
jgi:hypothetical protein